MTESCPECGHRFAADGLCEVHGRVRASEEYGLRIDIEFECANCETNILLEDAAAHDGVLGTLSDRQFEGGGYRA